MRSDHPLPENRQGHTVPARTRRTVHRGQSSARPTGSWRRPAHSHACVSPPPRRPAAAPTGSGPAPPPAAYRRSAPRQSHRAGSGTAPRYRRPIPRTSVPRTARSRSTGGIAHSSPARRGRRRTRRPRCPPSDADDQAPCVWTGATSTTPAVRPSPSARPSGRGCVATLAPPTARRGLTRAHSPSPASPPSTSAVLRPSPRRGSHSARQVADTRVTRTASPDAQGRVPGSTGSNHPQQRHQSYVALTHEALRPCSSGVSARCPSARDPPLAGDAEDMV